MNTNMGLPMKKLSVICVARMGIVFSVAECHDRGKMPRWTMKIPREVAWSYRANDGNKVYGDTWDVKPLMKASDYFWLRQARSEGEQSGRAGLQLLPTVQSFVRTLQRRSGDGRW